jgi:uncharacterized protein YjbK
MLPRWPYLARMPNCELIRHNTTATGLKVCAYLDTKDYHLKVKPSAQRQRSPSASHSIACQLPCKNPHNAN